MNKRFQHVALATLASTMITIGMPNASASKALVAPTREQISRYKKELNDCDKEVPCAKAWKARCVQMGVEADGRACTDALKINWIACTAPIPLGRFGKKRPQSEEVADCLKVRWARFRHAGGGGNGDSSKAGRK